MDGEEGFKHETGMARPTRRAVKRYVRTTASSHGKGKGIIPMCCSGGLGFPGRSHGGDEGGSREPLLLDPATS